jgi:hypothetical protein
VETHDIEGVISCGFQKKKADKSRQLGILIVENDCIATDQ